VTRIRVRALLDLDWAESSIAADALASALRATAAGCTPQPSTHRANAKTVIAMVAGMYALEPPATLAHRVAAVNVLSARR
jgi:hypothetical protein